MIAVSNKFKEAMKQPIKELDAYIKLDETNKLTSFDDLISFKVSCESGMCKTAMRKVEAKYLGTHDLLGRWVHIGFGAKTSDNVFEYLDYGSFLITEITVAKDTEITTIVGYDKMINAMTEYSKLENIEYPISLFDYTQRVCESCNLILANDTFTHADWPIKEELWENISGITYRDILVQIAQVTGSTCIIGTDDKVYFKYIIDTEEKLTYKNLKRLKLQPMYGEINSVVLARDPLVGEDVFLKDDNSIALNGLTEFKISNNEIVDKDRENAIQEIYDTLHGISYYPFEATTEGLGWYEIGDKFDIEIDTGSIYNSVLFQFSIFVDGAMKEVLKATANTKTQTQYQYASPISKRVKNTEITVNKQAGEIEQLTEETNENSSKIIKVTQDINNIQNLFQITGGNNLIKNSVGLFGNEYWSQSETGTFSFGEDSDLKGKTTSASKITISNGTLTSLATNIGGLTINTVKSFNFKIKQDEDTTTTVTLYGLSESSPIYQKTFTEKMDWQDIYTEEECRFFVDNPDLTLKIESSSTYNGKVEISDLMLNEGEKQAWQPSSGEVFGAVIQMNYMGLSCRSLAQKTITLLDGQGWRTCHFNGSDIGETITKQTVDGTDTNNLNVKYKITQSSFVKDVIPYHGKDTLVLYQKGVI